MKKTIFILALAFFSMSTFAKPVKDYTESNKTSLASFVKDENNISKKDETKTADEMDRLPQSCTVTTSIKVTYPGGSVVNVSFSSTSTNGCGTASANVNAAVSSFYQFCGCQ